MQEIGVGRGKAEKVEQCAVRIQLGKEKIKFYASRNRFIELTVFSFNSLGSFLYLFAFFQNRKQKEVTEPFKIFLH